MLIANQLHELGFRGMRAVSLKPKYIGALVQGWTDEGLSAGTLKNRLAALRWRAETVNREDHVFLDASWTKGAKPALCPTAPKSSATQSFGRNGSPGVVL